MKMKKSIRKDIENQLNQFIVDDSNRCSVCV
jgi:hypothetical protein